MNHQTNFFILLLGVPLATFLVAGGYIGAAYLIKSENNTLPLSAEVSAVSNFPEQVKVQPANRRMPTGLRFAAHDTRIDSEPGILLVPEETDQTTKTNDNGSEPGDDPVDIKDVNPFTPLFPDPFTRDGQCFFFDPGNRQFGDEPR